MGLRPGQTNKTSWQKGVSANPSGRPKGARNKFSKKAKDYIRQAVGKHIQNLEADLENMKPAERVKALSVIMKFVLSTKQEVKNSFDGDMKINVNYQEKRLEKEKEITDEEYQKFLDETDDY